MIRIAGLMSCVAALLAQGAYADEIRHTSLPAALMGNWASSPRLCAAKDQTNILVGEVDYRTGGASCTVDWVVETAGSLGPNYSVHASCADSSKPTVRRAENLIMRPESANRITVGKSFEDLKPYERCTAAE